MLEKDSQEGASSLVLFLQI